MVFFAVIFVLIMWLSSAPMFRDYDWQADVVVPEQMQYIVEAEGYGEVHDIVMGRCSMCHNPEPTWSSMMWPPKAVRLDNDAQIALNARAIYLHAGLSHAMPPGNVTGMTDDERAQIIRWYRGLGAERAALSD